MKKVIAPCEIASRDIIPAIKAIIVIQLHKKGTSQTQIASLLGITTAEVNYYIKGKRGNNDIIRKLQSDIQFMDTVSYTVEKIINDNDIVNLCTLCSIARKKILKDGSSCPFDW